MSAEILNHTHIWNLKTHTATFTNLTGWNTQNVIKYYGKSDQKVGSMNHRESIYRNWIL